MESYRLTIFGLPVNAFVSYSRRDNSQQRLVEIESLLRRVGDIYIDDLHHPLDVDRHIAAKDALSAADVFVAVLSATYAQTAWTRYELCVAANRGIPLLVLTRTGVLRTAQYEELLSRQMLDGQSV
jgi:TIR domain-containing protein